MDELHENEQQLLPRITERQKELLIEAEAVGGGIYRFRSDERVYYMIRIGRKHFPVELNSDPYLFAVYNEELNDLIEMKLLHDEGRDVIALTAAGWRVARYFKNK